MANNMSDEESGYKTYKHAEVVFEKMQPVDGDIMVITFPPDIHPTQMEMFGENLNHLVPEGVTVLLTRSGMKVEMFNESEMNKIGWHKFDTDKIN